MDSLSLIENLRYVEDGTNMHIFAYIDFKEVKSLYVTKTKTESFYRDIFDWIEWVRNFSNGDIVYFSIVRI
jgi:hypothetical protein